MTAIDDVSARVGVVDVGSDSTRLLIADVDGPALLHEVERRTTVTRLGSGAIPGRRLMPDARRRALAAVDGYCAAMERQRCGRRAAVLTSAAREASDGPELAVELEHRYGLDARLLSADEEAGLSFRGATLGLADGAVTLVIDVGGGSTELAVGAGGELAQAVSLDVGVVRQAERHLHDDPPLRGQIEALIADVRSRLTHVFEPPVVELVRTAIATVDAGSWVPGAVDRGELSSDRHDLHLLPRDRCEWALDRLRTMSANERRQLANMQTGRADSLLVGTVILLEAMRRFALDGVRLSRRDLLDGVALELALGGAVA